MTVIGCADVRENAAELALDVLSGADRAAALAHVSECAACRSLLTELTEAADLVPFLVAEADPPPGFRARVVQQMTTPRPSRRWWPTVLVAAAVMIAVAVAVGAVLGYGGGSPTRATAAGHVLPKAGDARSTTMVGAGGEQVGRLFITSRNPALMMVSVDYQVPSGTYAIEQRTGDGSPRRLGEMQVRNGHGTWGGTTAGGPHGSVELVDASGTVMCMARIPTS
jgi:hypothetical protein